MEQLESRSNPGHWATPTLLPTDLVAGLYWMPGDGPEAAVVLHTSRSALAPIVQADLAPLSDRLLVVALDVPVTPQPRVYDVVFDVKLPPQYAGFSGEFGGPAVAEVVNNQSDEYTGVIITHEVGHGVELQHVNDITNIMNVAPVEAGWYSWQITQAQEFLDHL